MVTMMGAPERVTPYQRCTRGDGVLDNGLAVFELTAAGWRPSEPPSRG
jgi:hypothetical protein